MIDSWTPICSRGSGFLIRQGAVMRITSIAASVTVLISFVPSVCAQRAPDVGYVFPPGGKAGTTVEVHLGGYNWTPDMELVSLDPRVKLTASGAPGPILIPPPPYWYGA